MFATGGLAMSTIKRPKLVPVFKGCCSVFCTSEQADVALCVLRRLQHLRDVRLVSVGAFGGDGRRLQ
eukprot:7048250-Lingulodinium_polyedra.AAC.1